MKKRIGKEGIFCVNLKVVMRKFLLVLMVLSLNSWVLATPVQASPTCGSAADWDFAFSYNAKQDASGWTCGSSGGGPDCIDFAASPPICHQKIVDKIETSCPPGYGDIFAGVGVFNTTMGPTFGSNCDYIPALYPKTCCKLVTSTGSWIDLIPRPQCELAPGKNWPGLLDADYCRKAYDAVAANTVYKDRCVAPYTYNPAVPDPTKRCVSVAPSGWEANIITCRTSTPGLKPSKGVETAIGCIPTSSLEDTGKFLFTWAFGLSGGVILLMGLFTAYRLMTSAGDPKKMEEIKENFTSIFAGLILIVFSLILLKTVGADIIKIPGLF